MSDFIKHECGIALIRLLKPLQYYADKYGTLFYGLNKLYLLMEKQHNRGQDGAGVATVKLDLDPGKQYADRLRSNSNMPIQDIFKKIYDPIHEARKANPHLLRNTDWVKQNLPFMGEVILGHLRYGTHGENSIEACHPFLRENNWMTRSLITAGNFNLTNVDDLFKQLVEIGQHPKEKSDNITVLEKIGHFLDTENQRLFDKYKPEGYNHMQLSKIISENLDLPEVLRKSAKDFDGGYVMTGLIGHGDAFVLRDPNGIRPAWYYHDDEVVVAASERPPIMTAFNVPMNRIKEVKPGHALIVRKDGKLSMEQVAEPRERKSCSFERIYFSRGTDEDIYAERKRLGYLMTEAVLKAIDNDLENTVFSFIPNTAEVAFYGLINGLEDHLNKEKHSLINSRNGELTPEELEKLLSRKPRVEKIAVKDAQLRTFITQDESRDELVSHIYDVTYGSVRPNLDTLVIMDDSIVRGTTLEKSILSILNRLNPKKIIVLSSAPQIRYPDCYGIDMSKIGSFVAFRAVIELLHEHNMEELIDEVYETCMVQANLPPNQVENQVKRLYDRFDTQQISDKISEIVKPKHIFSEVQIIYQSIENLHLACPEHKGDWYFSGDFPTPGGNQVVNRAFVNYMEGKNVRAY